jgi:Sel1 repeat
LIAKPELTIVIGMSAWRSALDRLGMSPQAQIVANAFVALGRYYLNGIPNSKIKPDTGRAREMFSYAASYFGNADAQYDLARLYLKTPDASREDIRDGARWLGLAAHKGQHQAQALLGQMLFDGDRLPPQRARGLMWLTLARDSATADETSEVDPAKRLKLIREAEAIMEQDPPVLPVAWERINDVWWNYVKGHNPYDYFGIYDVVRLDTFWLDK